MTLSYYAREKGVRGHLLFGFLSKYNFNMRDEATDEIKALFDRYVTTRTTRINTQQRTKEIT